MLTHFRKYSLAIAESFDAWRIVPRTILILYSGLVLNLYLWFRSIPTFVQERCDVGTLKMLLDRHIALDEAKTIACSIVDVVGGPTAAQSAFVTTITGLSAGIFGLYTATGRRWENGLPADVNRTFKYDMPNNTTPAVINKDNQSQDNNSVNDNNPPRIGENDGFEDEGPKL